MGFREYYMNVWVRNIGMYILMCLPFTFGLSGKGLEIGYYWKVLIAFGFTYVLILIHNTLVFERFLKRKNYLIYFLSVAGILILFTGFNLYTDYGITSDKELFLVVFTGLIILIFGLGFYFVHNYIIKRNILFENELYSREEEIRYLKAQLNPHFLFNALNNLYGISLSDPNAVSSKILELSDLLRYQIESSRKEFVYLRDELGYLSNYINYEKSRNHNIDFETSFDGAIDDLKIAPLLLTPFLENALKFSKETYNPFVKVKLSVSDSRLLLLVSNNYSLNGKEGTHTGLINTKKRLDLAYHNKHKLVLSKKPEEYLVELSIDL